MSMIWKQGTDWIFIIIKDWLSMAVMIHDWGAFSMEFNSKKSTFFLANDNCTIRIWKGPLPVSLPNVIAANFLAHSFVRFEVEGEYFVLRIVQSWALAAWFALKCQWREGQNPRRVPGWWSPLVAPITTYFVSRRSSPVSPLPSPVSPFPSPLSQLPAPVKDIRINKQKPYMYTCREERTLITCIPTL